MDVLFATANVGSIFEEPDVMLKGWLGEFLKTISDLKPAFVALHCQEVGGKNYESSMQYVGGFVDSIVSGVEAEGFNRSLVILDEDYSVAETFTALGNIYLVRKDVDECQVWNFNEGEFQDLENNKVFSGSIEAAPLLEKAKFPQEFFPECKWSRKGFLRTRWKLEGTVFDLINIHLFHDASNIVASQMFPNSYSLNRRKALDHTVQRFFHDGLDNVPAFFFGDFNFRLDTGGVVKACTGTDSRAPTPIGRGSSTDACQYFGENNELVFTLGKKEFSRLNHDEYFLREKGSWLLPYDREMEDFRGTLYEFAIDFPPTYPYQEDVNAPSALMKTRCPSWCDRVLLSHSARLLVDDPASVVYGMIGFGTCTGDHKPIYLKLRMKRDMGDGKDIVWERQDSQRSNRVSASAASAQRAASSTGSSSPPLPLQHAGGKSLVTVRLPNFSLQRQRRLPSHNLQQQDLPLSDFVCPACRANPPLDRSQSERKRPTSSKRRHQVASSTLSAESYAYCKVCRKRCVRPTVTRVRLHLLERGSSTRPLSHHSSSDEEWFEKVVEVEEKDEGNPSGTGEEKSRGARTGDGSKCCIVA